ncbi:MAG: hypothetical protein ACK5UE_08895 [Chitinophagales bacterium]|jgi:hypothetical protein
MKKTVLLAVVPLILIVIGCSKDSNSSGTNTNCTLSQALSGGKVFRPYLYTQHRNGVNIDQKYFYKTDSTLTTFQFNGNGVGQTRIKWFNSSFDPITFLPNRTYRDTTVALSYTINEIEKKISLSWYAPQLFRVDQQEYAIDSFNCNMFRTRLVTTNGTKIDELRTIYVND